MATDWSALRRIVVATSPLHVHKTSAAPLVGLFEFTTPEDWCGVIVKARFSGQEGDHVTVRRPEFLLATPAQADALERPVDFIPLKGKVDLLLRGHVDYARTSPGPVKLDATLSFGEPEIALELRADGPGRIPLAPPHFVIPRTSDPRMKPLNDYDPEVTEFAHKADFPWECTQSANPALVVDDLEEGQTLLMRALDGASSTPNDLEPLFEVTLPDVSPRVLIDPSHSGMASFEVPMRLDTVAVDVASRATELELTWRGMFPSHTGVRDVDRVLMGWASDIDMKDPSMWSRLLRELPHGSFQYAWFYGDARDGIAPPALTADEVKVQRYRTWNYALSPEPRISIEDLGAIEARLDQRCEPRAETLARFGLDEQMFAIEQRAWLEKVGDQSRKTGGRPPLAKQYTLAKLAAGRLGTDST